MKIIIAGSNTRGCESVVKRLNMSKLYSVLNEKKLIENWDDNYSLMVDSGAHSYNKKHEHLGMKSNAKLKPAEDFLKDYFKLIKKHKDKKVVWVELDVYKDLPESVLDRFYNDVMDLGIAGKLIRVYHWYNDPREGDYTTLEKWINQGQKYIGLGADNLKNFDDIFSMTKNEVKYHGFALTRIPVIEKYPFYSVDSTSPLSTVIFGRYTRPILAFNEREDILKSKSIECYHEDEERLENAILETKQTEEYITKLWQKRGVTWEDVSF
tara:strand:+ start:3536 stop:4336 length:801 start_codon:yes stop_codon:yes gene_type:complete